MALHEKLRQYRVIYIAVTLFFMWLGADAWLWFQENYEKMTEASAAGFISIYLAIIGALKYVLENSRQEKNGDR